MAENELLDVGNLRRWRLTRVALSDPSRSLSDVADCAAIELDKVLRQVASRLRKAEVFLALMKAAKGSKAEQQAVIASLKEKQLANTVLRAIKLAGTDDPALIASITARMCVEQVKDQIGLRAGKQPAYRSPEAKAALTAALGERFAASEKSLCATLEASMRGDPIKRIPRMPMYARPRLDAKTIVNMSLRPDVVDGSRVR